MLCLHNDNLVPFLYVDVFKMKFPGSWPERRHMPSYLIVYFKRLLPTLLHLNLFFTALFDVRRKSQEKLFLFLYFIKILDEAFNMMSCARTFHCLFK